MNAQYFDRFFTERIAEPVRGAVFQAIACAKVIAVNCWFNRAGDPCIAMLAGMSAVNDKWTEETFPQRKDEYDNGNQERKIAAALGVTEEEVFEVWTTWQYWMTSDDRTAFVMRMTARYAGLQPQSGVQVERIPLKVA